jgi:arabinogalactan endo-1,4-beta-galactosidase
MSGNQGHPVTPATPGRTGYFGKSQAVRTTVLALLILTGSVVLSAANTEHVASMELPVRGADISFTLQEEAINNKLKDIGVELPVEQILARHGATYTRLRVWVNPAPGTSDLEAALTLATRARAAGLKIVLNLHYSDTWADRTNQEIPAAWTGQDAEELGRTVETYTRSVVEAFAQQGTPADIVQIGNEITYGMLWPKGQIYREDNSEDWAGFAGLLEAGVKGAKAGNPADPPRIMMHTDTGGDRNGSVEFFDNLQQQGVSFDLIGLSYYPFWHGSLANLNGTLQALATRYDKDIIIAETAYPWTLASGTNARSVVDNIAELPDAATCPPTPEGQAKYFETLSRVLREVPGGHGAGYLVWEPGWLPGVPADARTENTHSNLTLFDWSGNGLPALEAFGTSGK